MSVELPPDPRLGSSVWPERLPCKQRPSPVRIRLEAQTVCDTPCGPKCRLTAVSMSSLVAIPYRRSSRPAMGDFGVDASANRSILLLNLCNSSALQRPTTASSRQRCSASSAARGVICMCLDAMRRAPRCATHPCRRTAPRRGWDGHSKGTAFARASAFIAQWHERALGMGEAPGSIPGEGSTVCR